MIDDKLNIECIKTKHVGSTYTCSPAPIDTDIDVLMLVVDQIDFVTHCMLDGYRADSTYVNLLSRFISVRKGNINIIVTQDNEFFNRFSLAADLCKKLNLLDKELRILVHETIINNHTEKDTPQDNLPMEDIPF